MNSITKINVELTFPQGAHFYQNINLYTYKLLLQFMYKMNCYAVDMKCCSCSLSKDCKYFQYTGENFKYYPNILIENSVFSKTILKNEEVLNLSFYIIGSNNNLVDYIKLFFNSYLNQKLAGHYFYLKKIEIKKEFENELCIRSFYISTPIETQNFQEAHNDMIRYYNKKYNTNFSLLKNNNLNISKIKKNHSSELILKTRKIYPNGYIYQVVSSENILISSIIKKIGIGKFNFIGGGKIED